MKWETMSTQIWLIQPISLLVLYMSCLEDWQNVEFPALTNEGPSLYKTKCLLASAIIAKSKNIKKGSVTNFSASDTPQLFHQPS